MSGLIKALLILVGVCFCLFVGLSGKGTILEFVELEELTEASDIIVLGKVLAAESGRDGGHGRIRTEVVFEVERVLKGSLDSQTLSIKLPGGFLPGENLGQVIPGMPRFTAGEEAVVFLQKDPNLFCPIAGWIQGKFDVLTDSSTGRKVVLDRFGTYRKYRERKAAISGKETVAGAAEIGIEEFADAISEIQRKKGPSI